LAGEGQARRSPNDGLRAALHPARPAPDDRPPEADRPAGARAGEARHPAAHQVGARVEAAHAGVAHVEGVRGPSTAELMAGPVSAWPRKAPSPDSRRPPPSKRAEVAEA
jgi:hypothetical protein